MKEGNRSMEGKITPKESLLKEIDIIQNIINRMAQNSFMIKGWALTLVVVTLLLKGNWYQIKIAFIPLLVFWFLDSFYLQQERRYRKLYEWVISNRQNTDEFLFDMRTSRFKNKVQSKPRIMLSTTLGWFYGTIAVLMIIYSVFLFKIQKGG